MSARKLANLPSNADEFPSSVLVVRAQAPPFFFFEDMLQNHLEVQLDFT